VGVTSGAAAPESVSAQEIEQIEEIEEIQDTARLYEPPPG